MNSQFTIPEPPYHPLSSFIVIVLDGIWGAGEIVTTTTVVGIPALPALMAASGITCCLSVSLTQHYLAHDTWGAAIAKGVAAGIIAGVPYFVAGTSAGVVMLAWAGLHNVLTSGKNHS